MKIIIHKDYLKTEYNSNMIYLSDYIYLIKKNKTSFDKTIENITYCEKSNKNLFKYYQLKQGEKFISVKVILKKEMSKTFVK